MSVRPRIGPAHLTDEAVAAYADDVLAEGPRARARQHMSECVECADAVRGQRATRYLLQAAAAPAVPGSLLERLRQVPSTAPMGALLVGAMTVDGQPAFPAYDTRQRMQSSAADTAPLAAEAGDRHRHLGAPVMGISAAALIVGVLAGTASAAGGTTARPDQPAVSVSPAGSSTSAGSTGDGPTGSLGSLRLAPVISVNGR